ncbi:virulence factor SrfC family protein [Dyadobacter diqingensis]|uniref:virulence factor SrfC family protein n=1 Tax=Dyadobacter diqingensis TaxID=2938121 RepID=UPI0020C1B83B|nr:virulence factor SrfC family protein [Dyadobacter diqingensis]
MSAKKAPYHDLIENCNALRRAIQEAKKWAETNLQGGKKNIFIDRLNDMNRVLMRYQNAAGKRPAVGVFGPSQVGKSFLVSGMNKRSSDGDTFVIDVKTGRHYNCLNEINPKGGQKESTGLVTRFTTDISQGSNFNSAVPLKLARQADIVKIIVDGYLSDLTTWTYELNRENVFKTFESLRQSCNPTESEQFTKDDVYEIRDYLETVERTYGERVNIRALNAINYWDELAAIVPFLNYQTRMEALKFVWGEVPFFNDTFLSLSEGLNQLRFAREVAVNYDSALVPREISIIDVERWSEIGMSERELNEKYRGKLKIALPDNPGLVDVELEGGTIVRMNRAILSGLGVELTLHVPSSVAEDPQRKFLNDVDCLDFPGARNRSGIDENGLKSEKDKQLGVFLRGKVSFLFNQYDLNLEINTFLMCLGDGQIDNSALVKLAYNWVSNNVGSSAESREQFESKLRRNSTEADVERFSPFMVVFTKYNSTLLKQPNNDQLGLPETYDQRWISRLGANFDDFFTRLRPNSNDNWLTNWNKIDGTFRNAYFLRDPNYSEAIFSGEYPVSKIETGIKEEYQQTMRDTEASFLENDLVRKFVRNPQKSWNETSVPNKSGIDHIIRNMTPTCNPAVKYEQLLDLICRMRCELKKFLLTERVGENEGERLRAANINSAKVTTSLVTQNMLKQIFGFFLESLMLTKNTAWSIYHDLVNSPVGQASEVRSTAPMTTTGRISLHKYAEELGLEIAGTESSGAILTLLLQSAFFSELPLEELIPILEANNVDWSEAEIVKSKDMADIFAEKLLYTGWSRMLGDLSRKSGALHADVQDLVIDHLRKNAERVGLATHIAGLVRNEINAYHPINNNNFELVASIATAAVNSYVLNAGNFTVEGPQSQTKFSSPSKAEIRLDGSYPGKRIFEEWQIAYKTSSTSFALGKLADKEELYAQDQLAQIIQKLPLEDCNC